jgi:glucose-1-phosphate cytidylyltransferase
MARMQVVILCGGRGTRMREETEVRPKPLVTVGGMPVLWHIMKIYSHYGYKDFVLCLGYKGEMIKEFFLNFEELAHNFTLNLRSQDRRVAHHDCVLEDWNITFADTGLDTHTGGRVKLVERFIEGDTFFLTYGDGLSNVDINALLEYHRRMGKIGTLTAIHPTSPFGVIETQMGLARSFKEKPRLEGLVNGGFFVFHRRFLSYLRDDSILEEEPLKRLTAEHELAVYEHSDFWQCVDTFKDVERLNKMWDDGQRPWVLWK